MVYLTLLAATASACRKPYAPKPILQPAGYLVVEGVINPGADSTVITLSRSVNLADSTSSAMETNANVTVENEGGVSYTLVERKPDHRGQYLAVGLNIDQTKKYRLHITTSESKEYVSDFVPVKPTPAIDSISYKITPKGLQINSDTHDATNNTRYYRIAYEESWKFHAHFHAGLIVKNGTITSRKESEDVYYCYRGDRAANIVLASSEKLQQDVIADNAITLIPPTSEKLSIRYSILLKQYALTKDAYAFWENIRKNTEQLGSIFDAQPSQLKGNIHSVVSPNEPVIGFVSITNVQTKRIFVDNRVLPSTWNVPDDGLCENFGYLLDHDGTNEVELFIIRGGLNPIDAIVDPVTTRVIGYHASTVSCTDCTLRGTVTAPAFWNL